jgi:hypothetical protein
MNVKFSSTRPTKYKYIYHMIYIFYINAYQIHMIYEIYIKNMIRARIITHAQIIYVVFYCTYDTESVNKI